MRRAVGTTLAVVAALAWAQPAVAAVKVEGTLVTPTTLKPSTRTILYYLQLRTGDAPERFSVRFTPPRFARLGALEGHSIDGPIAIALQGPGTIGQTNQASAFVAACSERVERTHGYVTGAAVTDIALPANTATTVAVRYATGDWRPWRDGDYRLRFRVQPTMVGTYEPPSPLAGGPTVTRSITARTSGPKVGSSGLAAHLILSSTPKGTVRAGRSPRSIKRSTRIRLRGRVVALRSRRTVVLEWSRPTGKLHTIARVRTDRRGRFTGPRWKPPRTGTYELWARYPKQRGGLAADTTSCPIRFRVR